MTPISRYILAICFCTLAQLSFGQFTGGFKAGLNLSNIQDSDPITSSTGEALESTKMFTGFHVGPTGQYAFTELFGMRAEFLFTQKGTVYRYDGQGVQRLKSDDDFINAYGPLVVDYKINNSYLEIPVMGYAKLGRIEGYIGLYGSVLVSSRGDGNLKFSGKTSSGSTVPSYSQDLVYNFLKDKPGQRNQEDVTKLDIGSNTVSIPNTARAYEQLPSELSSYKRFSAFDYGALGGLTFYINSGLYMSARGTYGFADITKNDNDYSLESFDGQDNLRALKRDDNIWSIQFSIGFNL